MLPQIKKYGIIPNKDYGQNFLIRQDLLSLQIEYARVQKEDIILEIGPGIGNLTELLLQKAQKVVAVEKDLQFQNCLGDLQKKYNNLEVYWEDATRFPFPPFNKVVANLPFLVSLPVTFKILEYPFSKAILLYQKTMAERICALPGEEKYSRVSVQIQRLGSPRLLQIVKKNDFYPPPEVDCALMEIEKREPLFLVQDKQFFKNSLDYLFFYRDVSLKEACLSLQKKNRSELFLACMSKLDYLLKKKVHRILPQEFGVIVDSFSQYKIQIPATSDGKKKKAQQIRKAKSS